MGNKHWGDDWAPTPENVNALPGGICKYIHDLEANCDPSGLVAENTLVKDNCRMLEQRYIQQQERIRQLEEQIVSKRLVSKRVLVFEWDDLKDATEGLKEVLEKHALEDAGRGLFLGYDYGDLCVVVEDVIYTGKWWLSPYED